MLLTGFFSFLLDVVPHRSSLRLLTSPYLRSHSLLDDGIPMERCEIRLVHILHVLLIDILCPLWNDDRGCHTKSQHSCNHFFLLLWDLESVLGIYRTTASKF